MDRKAILCARPLHLRSTSLFKSFRLLLLSPSSLRYIKKDEEIERRRNSVGENETKTKKISLKFFFLFMKRNKARRTDRSERAPVRPPLDNNNKRRNEKTTQSAQQEEDDGPVRAFRSEKRTGEDEKKK